MFVNQFNIIDGKVEILGERYVMLDSSSLLSLQEIDKSKMYAIAKDISKNSIKNLVDHAQVYKNIKDLALKEIVELSKKIGKTDEGVIQTLQTMFELYGLGKLKIYDLNNEKKSAVLMIDNSTMALAQLKEGKTKKTSCTLTAGILAGMFTYVFGREVDCVEKKCKGKGDDFCEFEVS